MKGKLLLLLAAVVVLVAGVEIVSLTPDGAELSPARVVVRAESLEDGAFRWRFVADDGQGKPLETVFYTEEWSPAPDGGIVDVVVRLYEEPAEGRTPLHSGRVEDSASDEFVLTCTCPDELARQYPNASYRITLGGRSLGAWRMGAQGDLAAALESLR